MKRLVALCVLLLPLSLGLTADGFLVKIPVPQEESVLQQSGFQLYGRAEGFWIGRLPEGAALPAGGQVLERYQSEAGELFLLQLDSPQEGNKLPGLVNVLHQEGREVVMQATLPQLQALPPLRAEWTRITLDPKPYAMAGYLPPQADDFSPFVPDMVAQVSQEYYTNYLQTLQDFATRNTYTSNCDDAAAWILGQFQSFGLNAYYDFFTIGGATKRNVVAELPGTVYPDSVLFITAHYDATIGQPWTAEPIAPGADDNGSGTACVLECARILSMYNFEKTIRFVAFAGEEQGLIGSQYYVQHLAEAGTAVVGSFNYDMIAVSGGGAPPYGLSILCNNDPFSQAMAAKIEEAVETFVPTFVPYVYISPGSAGSDHYPFWMAGWPATFSIHAATYPYYHTAEDLIVNCDMEFAANCTRAAIAALADFAEPLGGGTEVSGSVAGVWTPAGNPYHITDSTWVAADSTLIIEPGVLILFDGPHQFKVWQNATLRALGTAQQPIVFTPLDIEQGWGGIRFWGASDSCRLEFCQIRYGLAVGTGDNAQGGGIFCYNSSPTITQCVMHHCSAEQGGALACIAQSNPVLESCTFADNDALLGNGLYCNASSPTLRNCILWDNYGGEIFTMGVSDPQASYCDVRGGWEGEGNLDTDPLFVAAELGNYHLQSVVGSYAYGSWQPNPDTSPCIDAGDPSAPWALEPEPNGNRLDMGAYGNTAQASLSLNDPHYAFGEVSGSWTLEANSPMYVIGDIAVPAGEILTIEPGVQVVFQGHHRFEILENAALVAEGTLEDSISFGAEDPEAGWHGLRFISADSSSRLAYCHLTSGNAYGSSEAAFGGAVYCSNTNLLIEHCLMDSCMATNGGAIYGANSDLEIRDCALLNNQATSGGSLYIHQSNPLIQRCVFSGNTSTNGGAMTLWFSAGELRNNVLYNNLSNGYGGGIYCFNSNPNLENNVLAADTANNGGGIYSVGTNYPSLTSCILWENAPNQIALGSGSNPPVSYCDIQGGWAGEGNLEADPSFVSAASGDYHLSLDSPCIDAGSPQVQYNDPADPVNPGYALWPALGTVRNDLGAYGGQGAAGWVGIAAFPEINVPTSFSLQQNYPNPFNPITSIRFALPRTAYVELTVCDLQGRKVAMLVQGVRPAGEYRATWDAAQAAAGIYFCRLRVGEQSFSRKMILLK